MARIKLLVDDRPLIDAEVNLAVLLDWFQTIEPLEGSPEGKSTPITPDQAEMLIQRIDPKSVEFLRRISANKGYVTWSEMKYIFGIKSNEWSEYTSRHGKGITRALRHITGGKFDTLVHWNDDDPEWNDKDNGGGKVYIDGKALDALRIAFKVN